MRVSRHSATNFTLQGVRGHCCIRGDDHRRAVALDLHELCVPPDQRSQPNTRPSIEGEVDGAGQISGQPGNRTAELLGPLDCQHDLGVGTAEHEQSVFGPSPQPAVRSTHPELAIGGHLGHFAMPSLPPSTVSSVAWCAMHKFPVVAAVLPTVHPRFGISTVRSVQDIFPGRRLTRPTALLGRWWRRSLEATPTNYVGWIG